MVYASFFMLGYLGAPKGKIFAAFIVLSIISAATTVLYVFRYDFGLSNWYIHEFSYAFTSFPHLSSHGLNLIEAVLFYFTGSFTLHFLNSGKISIKHFHFVLPALLIVLFLYSGVIISIHEPCSILGLKNPCIIGDFDPHAYESTIYES